MKYLTTLNAVMTFFSIAEPRANFSCSEIAKEIGVGNNILSSIFSAHRNVLDAFGICYYKEGIKHVYYYDAKSKKRIYNFSKVVDSELLLYLKQIEQAEKPVVNQPAVEKVEEPKSIFTGPQPFDRKYEHEVSQTGLNSREFKTSYGWTGSAEPTKPFSPFPYTISIKHSTVEELPISEQFKQPPMPNKSIVDLLTGISDAVADMVVDQLRPMLSKEISERVQAMTQTLFADVEVDLRNRGLVVAEKLKSPVINVPVAEVKKQRLPKICIIGLMPQQAGAISQQFSEVYDITFLNVNTGSSFKQIEEHAESSIAVFTHTKHISHSVENVIKASGGKLIRVSGGVTSMVNALTEFYCNI